jgi:putative transposase
MVRALLTLLSSVFRSALAFFRSRENQAIVELALRQQLAVYVHCEPGPRLSPLDRAFWVALARLWPEWRKALVLVRPETVIAGTAGPFGATGVGSRSPAPATEKGWRARKIQAELSRLGIHLGLTTISRYLPKASAGESPQQRWRTFLRNHRDWIAGMDFFVVPTVGFQLLYVWFVLGRRRVVHFNVTAHPTAEWVVQQLRDAFPDALHRFLIFDDDAIFSPEVARSIRRFGLHPRRAALQSPWQNGTAGRFVGSVRRELLDHVIVPGKDHLRRLVREYVAYYNAERVQTSIRDAPGGRAVQERTSNRARVIGWPRVGGLHHRYAWSEAA